MMASGEYPQGILNNDISTLPSLEQISEAVRIILDPTSSAHIRSQAHNLCEQVKNHPLAPQCGFQLATLQMSLSTRLFGLNMLENYIRTRMAPSDTTILRDGVWGLLSLVVSVPLEERRLMQDKVAMLVAQLAMRIWPQYWPDFFDRLLELVATKGDELENPDGIAVVRTEMGLLMARMVVDEVHPREGTGQKLIWDDTRRPELQKALSVVLPLMLQRFNILIPHCSNWSAAAMKSLKLFLESILESFASISLWATLENESTLNIVSGILRMASTSTELAGSAFDVLLTLAGRPTRPQELDLISDLFDRIVDPLGELFSRFATIDDYEYFKKLTDIIVTLSVTNIGHKKAPRIPKRMDSLIDLLLQLSNFPSLLITTNVGSFWHSISKCEKILTDPVMTRRLPSLFLYTLMTLAMNKESERIKKPYNVEDFGEPGEDPEADNDFDALFTAHQNRIMDILRNISLFHPALFIGYCGNALVTFIRENEADLTKDLGSIRSLQWSALMHTTDCIIKACLTRIAGSMDTDGQIGSQIVPLSKVLMSVSPSSLYPDNAYMWLVALRSLVATLGILKVPEFNPLMQQLFDLTLSYEITTPNYSNLDSMRHAIRARAGSVILKVCHSHPQLFLPALDYLVSLFNSSVEPKSNQKLRERRLFTEILLIISGCMEDSAKRVELVRLVLGPLVEALEMNSSSLSSWENLAVQCGLGSLLPGFAGLLPSAENCINYRKELSNINALLYIVLQQLKELAIAGDIKAVVNQFTPNVSVALGRYIIAVHSIFDRRNFDPSVHAQWDSLFPHDWVGGEGLPATEKILDADVMADNMETAQPKSIQSWLFMLRVSCYMNYGSLFTLSPQLMYNNSLENFFERNESFSLSQWATLIKHLVSPFLLNLPNELVKVPTVMNNAKFVLLLLIERFGLVNLEGSWQVFRNSTSQNNNNSIEVVKAESAYETLLSTATTGLLSLLYDILYPLNERDKRGDPALELSHLKSKSRPSDASTISSQPLTIWIVSDCTVSSKIVLLLAACMRWKPTLAMSKTLPILLRWLPTWMNNHNLHETLFTTITGNLLASISSSTLGDQHPTVISVLTELYKWQLYFDYDVVDKQILTILNQPTLIQELRTYFYSAANSPQPITAKTQRAHVKSTLVRALQQQALSAVGVTSTIPRLPDRLILLKKIKSQAIADDANLDLAALFDQ